MDDVVYKGRLEGLEVAFAYVLATRVCNEAIIRHDHDPVAAHLMARALGAGLLYAAPLNERERVNIRWTYHGALKTIIVDAGADGAVRGFVSPHQLPASRSIDELYGEKGTISVVRSEFSKVTSSGTGEAPFRDVVEDLVFFSCISDQVETCGTVLVAFDPDPRQPVRLCRGLFLQALPGCNLARFHHLRERLASDRVRTRLAHESETDNLFEDVLHLMQSGKDKPINVHMTRSVTPVFRCNCSRDKMGAVVRSLPESEREDIKAKGEDLTVRCHFCNERYILSVEECTALWQQQESNP